MLEFLDRKSRIAYCSPLVRLREGAQILGVGEDTPELPAFTKSPRLGPNLSRLWSSDNRSISSPDDLLTPPLSLLVPEAEDAKEALEITSLTLRTPSKARDELKYIAA